VTTFLKKLLHEGGERAAATLDHTNRGGKGRRLVRLAGMILAGCHSLQVTRRDVCRKGDSETGRIRRYIASPEWGCRAPAASPKELVDVDTFRPSQRSEGRESPADPGFD
jgi:hypothetical protein